MTQKQRYENEIPSNKFYFSLTFIFSFSVSAVFAFVLSFHINNLNLHEDLQWTMLKRLKYYPISMWKNKDLPSPVIAQVLCICQDFDEFWSEFFVAIDDDEDDAMLLSGKPLPSMLESVPDETERAMGESSSWSPNNFSSSFGSLAIGKSCLLARIKSGVP